MFNLIIEIMKKYLFVTVKMNSGHTFTNRLKLSEAYLISQLAQENKFLTVHLCTCDKAYYKMIFG